MTIDPQQIEHILHRENLRMAVCDRLICVEFGMGMTASKKERTRSASE